MMLNLKAASIWKPAWALTQLLKDHIFQVVRKQHLYIYRISDITYHQGKTLRSKHVTGQAAGQFV